MFLTAHTAVALKIAQVAPNPALAFVFGVISHFILDAIPHGDESIGEGVKEGNYKKVLMLWILGDGLFILTMFFSLWWWGKIILDWRLVAAVGGAILPDALQIPRLIYKNPPRIFTYYFPLHDWFHRLHERFKVNLPIGLMLQGIVVLVSITWLFL